MASSNGITRKISNKTVTIAAGTALTLSDAINFEDYASMAVVLTSTGAFTGSPLLAFRVATSETGTYYPLYGSTGNLLQVSVAVNGKAYECPEELFPWAWVKLWLQTSGSYIAQAAAKNFIVVMKA